MKLSLPILLILLALPAFSQILTVEIAGIKTDKGSIVLSVYRDSKTFEAETPYRVYKYSKEGMIEGKLNATISDLAPGTYGIALIDDTNNNGKMDFRLFVPTEGFGFSNYYFKGSRKPDFDVFSFILNKEESKVRIKVQYP